MKKNNKHLTVKTFKFSGTLELETDSNIRNQIITYFNLKGRRRRRSDGYYIFPGGVISPPHLINYHHDNLELLFRFKNCKTSLLDFLVTKALSKFRLCKLNFALHYHKINYTEFKNKLNLKRKLLDSDNFEGILQNRHSSTKIYVYPRIQLLTCVSKIQSVNGIPSLIISDLFKNGM
jgi:hypothetical protein